MSPQNQLLSQRIDALSEMMNVRFIGTETAVQTAFLAQERLFAVTSSASEVAIVNLESKLTILRDSVDEQIASLRESRSEVGGKEAARHQTTTNTHWIISLVFGLLCAIAGYLAK